MMPELTDVDTAAEAELVAGEVPGSAFAAAFGLALASSGAA